MEIVIREANGSDLGTFIIWQRETWEETLYPQRVDSGRQMGRVLEASAITTLVPISPSNSVRAGVRMHAHTHLHKQAESP